MKPKRERNLNRTPKGKIANGILMITIATVFLLILFNVFSRSGAIVKNFLVGTFGFAIYSYFITLAVIGVITIFNFKPEIKLKRLIALLGIYISVILISHVATSNIYIEKGVGYADDFVPYLRQCYLDGMTAGGVLGGVVTYILQKINVVLVFLVLALVLILFMVSFINSYKSEDSTFFRMGKGIQIRNKKRIKEVGGGLLNQTKDGQEFADEIPLKTKKKRKKGYDNAEFTSIEEDEELIKQRDQARIEAGAQIIKEDLEKIEAQKSGVDTEKPKSMDPVFTNNDEKIKPAKVETKVEQPKIENKNSEDEIIVYKDPNPHNNYVPEDGDMDIDQEQALELLFGEKAKKPSSAKKKEDGVDFENMTESEKAYYLLYGKNAKSKKKEPEKREQSSRSIFSKPSSSSSKKEDSVSPKKAKDEEIMRNLAKTYSTDYMKRVMAQNIQSGDSLKSVNGGDLVFEDRKRQEVESSSYISDDDGYEEISSTDLKTTENTIIYDKYDKYSKERGQFRLQEDEIEEPRYSEPVVNRYEDKVSKYEPLEEKIESKPFRESPKAISADDLRDVEMPSNPFSNKYRDEEEEKVQKPQSKPVEEEFSRSSKLDEILGREDRYSAEEILKPKKPKEDDFDLEAEREKVRTRAVRSDKGGTHKSQYAEVDRQAKKSSSSQSSSDNSLAALAKKFNVPVEAYQDNEPEVEAVEEEPKEKKKTLIRFDRYVAPTTDLLKTYEKLVPAPKDKEENIKAIEDTLESFKIEAKVVNTITGPTFTRYELEMGVGVSVSNIEKYESDIMMNLGAENIFIQAPIPGKKYVGIEVPNKKRGTVGLKEIVESEEFTKGKGLSFAIGQDVDGENYVCDITKMPHVLIAGATGAGKSVCINTLICSILFKYSPEDVRLLLIDPKRVELTMYNNLPHMLLPEALSEPVEVLNALDWACEEMEKRYNLFKENLVQNIEAYNKKVDLRRVQKMPYIVIVVDEVADLVMALKKSFEQRVVRLAQKARAAGIHIVLATQRPSVDVITGLIKANLPARIAFTTTSITDSKTILDYAGAEKLLRLGDMLLSMAQYPSIRRVQGAFIDAQEVVPITQFIRKNNRTYFDPEIEEIIKKEEEDILDAASDDSGDEKDDPTNDIEFLKALRYCIDQDKATASSLQTRFAIGYPKAARYIAQMQKKKFIGVTQGGNKGCPVNITADEFELLFGEIEY